MQKGCHTLSEWINSGGTPFSNDTKVLLLAGVHLINSLIKGKILIKNLHSLVVLGEQSEATIFCIPGFTIEFNTCQNVSISHIVFDSCTLLLSRTLENITLTNTTILNGALKIYNGVYNVAGNSSKQSINCCQRKNNSGSCKILESISISDSSLSNSSIDSKSNIKGIDCLQLAITRVIFKNIRNSLNALSVNNGYRVTITDVNVNNNRSPFWTLSISHIHTLTLINMTILKIFSPILLLEHIKYVTIGGQNLFLDNYATGFQQSSVTIQAGGIKFITIKEHSEIKLCSNYVQGVLIGLYGRSNLTMFKSKLIFINNTSEQGGIMVLEDAYSNFFNSKISFENNTSERFDTWDASYISSCTTLLLQQSSIVYFIQSIVLFRNNSATISGGITLISSHLVFENSIATFEFNQGGDGGAMTFYQKSYIVTRGRGNFEAINLHFYHNKAVKRGGAIFVEDLDYMNSVTRMSYVFFIRRPQDAGMPGYVYISPQIHISHNSALIAGNDIYGGWIDAFYHTLHISWKLPENNLHAVTSNPTHVCICINAVPACNIYKSGISLFPGQTFNITAVAVGQRMGIVPSIVISKLSDSEGRLGQEQDVQSVDKQCSTLTFTVYSEKNLVDLNIDAQDIGIPNKMLYLQHLLPPKYYALLDHYSMNITLKDCPLGFQFDKKDKTCLCIKSIQAHNGVDCNYYTFEIIRDKQQWLSATLEHNSFHYPGVIVHDQCPHDYSRSDPGSLSFHLEFPDKQCAFHRSGVLCGACQSNYSQVLGSALCKECSNMKLLVVIPTIIVAGIVLVGILMLFNLTVSTGTINAIIFYANVIRASQSVFFPSDISNSFLSIFIAWLNLDLGIETCFYNGLDSYAKTWLQFVFPFYIWLIVITIIVASHYFTVASRLTPNNAVQVLSTLFLLSYTKMLRVVITVFSFTILEYPDGYKRRVWLYDGNIEFLRGKHMVLFIATLLLLILLSVPYTLSLVSIQWLQKVSHHCFLSWVHKLMPLFDAYTGPYKHKHRYWTGLLLLVRVLMLIVFSLNQANDPAVNLITITMIATVLTVYASYMDIYKNWLHNVIEILSLLNLAFLSVVILYDSSNTILATKTSSTVTFISFILITFYHSTWRLMSLRKMRQMKSKISAKITRIRGKRDDKTNTGCGQAMAPNNNQLQVTHTSVELMEPLIN